MNGITHNILNRGYLNAIRTKNNVKKLREIPRYHNPNVFGMTFKTKKWNEVHEFAIHCVHCIQQRVCEAKKIFTRNTNGIIILSDQKRWDDKRRSIIFDVKSEVYESLDALKQHLKDVHQRYDGFDCIYPACNHRAISWDGLISHIPSHESDYMPYRCQCKDGNKCNFRGSTKKRLVKHIENGHFIKVVDVTPILHSIPKPNISAPKLSNPNIDRVKTNTMNGLHSLHTEFAHNVINKENNNMHRNINMNNNMNQNLNKNMNVKMEHNMNMNMNNNTNMNMNKNMNMNTNINKNLSMSTNQNINTNINMNNNVNHNVINNINLNQNMMFNINPNINNYNNIKINLNMIKNINIDNNVHPNNNKNGNINMRMNQNMNINRNINNMNNNIKKLMDLSKNINIKNRMNNNLNIRMPINMNKNKNLNRHRITLSQQQPKGILSPPKLSSTMHTTSPRPTTMVYPYPIMSTSPSSIPIRGRPRRQYPPKHYNKTIPTTTKPTPTTKPIPTTKPTPTIKPTTTIPPKQYTPKPKTVRKPIPNPKGTPFNRPSGIPRLKPNQSEFEEPEFMQYKHRKSIQMPFSKDNPHSIIYPYFMTTPLIPIQTTSFIAESGAFDDHIPPLLIPIVPAAFMDDIHDPYKKYGRGNERENDQNESMNPYIAYHRESWFPPKTYCHPENMKKKITITEEFHFCGDKVDKYCKRYKYWFKRDKGRAYIAEKKRKREQRMIEKDRNYKESIKKWNRRRKRRRMRHLKRWEMKRKYIENDDEIGLNYTDCTTCSDYDSSTTTSDDDDGYGGDRDIDDYDNDDQSVFSGDDEDDSSLIDDDDDEDDDEDVDMNKNVNLMIHGGLRRRVRTEPHGKSENDDDEEEEDDDD